MVRRKGPSRRRDERRAQRGGLEDEDAEPPCPSWTWPAEPELAAIAPFLRIESDLFEAAATPAYSPLSP